jgi:hypothetical protein
MASRIKLTDAETLDLYRVVLDNAVNQTEVATIMAELGYDSAIIEEGKTLLEETRKAYDLNKTEDDETSASYTEFSSKKGQLEDTYTLQCKSKSCIPQ